MTNTLHAFIDRILDVTRTLPLKAIRLLAGGEAKIGGTLASVIFGPTMLGVTAPTAHAAV